MALERAIYNAVAGADSSKADNLTKDTFIPHPYYGNPDSDLSPEQRLYRGGEKTNEIHWWNYTEDELLKKFGQGGLDEYRLSALRGEKDDASEWARDVSKKYRATQETYKFLKSGGTMEELNKLQLGGR